MADFLLTVGVDPNLSYAEMQKGITELVSRLNSNPMKIKVQFDEASINSMKQQIQAVYSSIGATSGNSSSTSAAAATKAAAQASREAQQAATAAATATRQSAQADKEKTASAQHAAAAEKAKAQAAKQAAQAEREAQTAVKAYNTAIVQGETALRNWTAAEKSKNQSSRAAYQELKSSVDAMRSAKSAYDNGTGSIETLKAKTDAYRATLKTTEQTLKANGDATKSLSERMGSLAQKFASWLTVSQLIMLAVRSVRQMVSASIELDDAMTQMQIVTKASTAEMNEFADSAAAASKRVASSISDFVDSATTYARLGYTMSESSQLAEYTAMLQNVGDIDVSDAQDAITSIVKAFDVDTSEIESVMDKLVTTGNNFPISVSQIAEGMTNASSSLAAAGNSFEQSVALLTAANTTIQDASKSSTGLRTIAARIRNTTTELDELGETMTEASYEELVQMLTDCNVALTDVNGEYRSTYDIMSDIATQWEHMTSMEQAALATALSGTRQQAVFYSIIEQFQEASGAMDAMADSAGALDEAYSVYMESTTAHINQFKAAFQELSADVFQSEFLQFFIDLGAGILSLVDGVFKLINAFGGMKTALIAIAGIIATIKADALVTLITTTLPAAISRLISSLTSFVGIFARIPTIWKSFHSGTALAVQGTSRFSTALKALGISASTAQIAVGALVAIITIAVAAYNRWKQAQEENRQEAIAAAKDAAELSTEITELVYKYDELSSAIGTNGNASQELISTQDELVDKLGITKSKLEELRGEYSSLSDAIKQLSVEKLQEAERDIRGGLNAYEEELLKAGKSDWGIDSKSISGSKQNGLFSTSAETRAEQRRAYEALKALEDAGLISSSSYSSYTDDDGSKYSQGFATFIGLADDEDLSTVEGITNAYERLGQMLDIVSDTAGSDNFVYETLYDTYNDLTGAINNYEDAIGELNTNLAEQYAIQGLIGREIPSTQEEFDAYRDSVVEAAKASGEFVGSDEDIADSVDNFLMQQSQFVDFYSDYFNELAGLGDKAEEAKKAMSFSDLMAEDGDDSFSAKVDGYVSSVQELQDALDALSSGDFDESDFVELVEKYPELAKNSDNLTEAIKDQIKELTGYESVVDSTGETVSDATGIIAVFEDAFGRVDSDEDVAALQAFMDAVLELGEVVGSTQFAIDIDAETNGMENLWTAMKESVSSTGLTAESIANLKARYQDLENYDAAKLFEKTANGVHLNTKALRELEAEYESTKKAQIDADLEDLVEQYNDLTEQINNADDAASTADLYAQRSKILEQIDDTTLLAAQYEGLTSAFYKWEQAQSIGEEGDMYDSLAGSLEDIKELYDEGLIGTNKFRTAVQLMSNEDLSTASVDELLAAYEAGYSKMTRYFTDSSDGCLNFLNDIQKLNSEWVKLNDDGSWDINFGLGNDQEIADALGINVESIQAIMRKLSDYGFDINLDSIYSNLDLLQTYAEKANDALKELGSTDYTFNFNTTDLEYATEQIEVAQSLLDQFKNDDGTVNLELDGAEEAQTILVALITNKQTLSAPAIMSIDTTALDEADAEIGAALQLLQEFVSYSNDLEIDTALGVDTTETQQKIQDVATKLSELPDETKVAIGIDGEDFSSQLQSIVDADVDVEAGVSINQADIDSVISTIGSINPETIELQTNADAINAELTAIDEYTIDDKDFSVTVHDYASTKLQNINSYVRSLPSNKSITVTTYTKTVSASKANGTAHADGTAMADGYWGVKNPEPSLGGEIGQELVVRNGRFFTIGDDSAEIFHPQKDDIIFNADQTEQIFKYGKIKSGAKRGRTFASGTAYSSGSGKITVGGSVITTPTGGGSSSSSSSSNSSSSDEDDTEIIDWIEIAIDRIERAINNLSTVAKSAFRTLSEKLTATNDEISEMTYEMSMQQSAYNRYIQEANSVGLSSNLAAKVQNGTIDINEYDSDTADLIKSYQEWYEKALDCSDAILELSESIAELYQNKFDDVASDYENQLSLLEHLTNTYNNGIEDLEERGYLASTKYYTALQDVEKQNIVAQKKELSDLTKAMSEAINSGYIEEGSEAWYEMQQEINAVKEAIQESEMALEEYANAIRDIKWERFDYIQEQISNITEEADFLIDLLDNSDLYTDNGQLTDIGMAAMGLHGQNYNVYMAQADKYAEELLALNEEIANDPNNTTLLERREELLEAQRDCILAAEDEKQAIVDMVKEGIELELAALQELITSYTNALDSAKDLYDYQKKIKDQTSEIASLQKQLAAYSGDTSEETRATIQKIQVDLADAMEDLEETQYEHYISEQKKMLDNLYDEYEMILNQRLDDVDALISDMIDMINVNSASISDTISAQSEAVGYTLSESMKEIWTNEGGAYSIITKYGESFTGQFTSINNVLNAISTNVAAMVAASEATATSNVDSTSESTPTTGTQGSSGGGTSTPKPPASDNTSSNKYSEAVKQGVAAAIWIYGGSKSGWGNNPERKKRLTEKFGSANASAIQGYINAHGSNGDLYKYWVNSGKSALSQYYYSAFKKGGLADYTGMAWLDGTPTEPEMVLNSEDTANFIALKDAMRSVANGDSPLAALFGVDGSSSQVLEKLAQLDSPAARAATTIGDVTYEITIPIDHVSDYEDFMNQLRKDGKFEKFIQSITLDRITGGSKLAKNRYQW